uniref:(northern house mosquito) hypothetical protein n=1 Tax=Culex pipiens TaxID=7175 RepID=A0A8D8KXF3_CULPI
MGIRATPGAKGTELKPHPQDPSRHHREPRRVICAANEKQKASHASSRATALTTTLGYPKTAQLKGRLHLQDKLWMAARGKVNCLKLVLACMERRKRYNSI